MPGSTGLLPFAEQFPDRFFDVGIAEQHAVTAAAGMAMGGLRPVVAIYSTFLTRAFDQVDLRRRPARAAGGVLPRPRRHHRRRRPVAPRRARHGAAHEGAGHDDLRPVVGPGARGDAATALSITDGPVRHPLVERRSPPSVPPDQVGSGLPARGRRRVGEVCILAVGKMLAAAEEAAPSRPTASRPPCGTCASSSRSTPT